MQARDWDGLAKVVKASAKDSSMDEMVQLCWDNRDQANIAGVRRVIFHRIEDIPRLLDEHISHRLPSLAEARFLHVEPRKAPKTDEGTELAEPSAGVGDAEETRSAISEEALTEQADNLAGDEYTNEAAPVEFPPTYVSEKEDRAARVIQRAFRRTLHRPQISLKKPGDAFRARLLKECLVHERTVEWVSKALRHMYLDGLPYLMHCIERTLEKAKDIKNDIKKRRAEGHTLDAMDDMNQRQTKMKFVLSPFYVTDLH